MAFPNVVRTEAELRVLFRKPAGVAVAKEIDRLDAGCRSFIAHAPFVLIGTRNPDGTGDVSPKGGPPGFWHVLDDHRLIMGDLPGNNRLDTYRNILVDPAIGLLFLVPGVDETLRVNGSGSISVDADLRDRCTIEGRVPKVVLCVDVRETFLHCGKAFWRSGLWQTERWPDTADMTTPSCMFNDVLGVTDDPDGARTAAMLTGDYRETLWRDR